MELTYRQKMQVLEEGYTVVRGAVPTVMLEEARGAINRSLGTEGMHPDELASMRSKSYCPSLMDQPVLTDLVNRSPLFDLAESAVGRGNLLTVPRGQIALRFPGHGLKPDKPDAQPKGHIDGIGTGINGIPVGEFRRNFTMLIVILLADLPEPDCGNFTVWPGSHLAIAQYFRDSSPDVLKQGMPDFGIDCVPRQFTGRAGDAAIVHHLLLHGVSPHHGPDIRYAAIFRGRHKDVETIGNDALTNPWREWEGLHDMQPQTTMAV